MGYLKILQLALVVVIIHGFIQRKMCEKSIIIKNKYIGHFKYKIESENINSYNWYMFNMIINLINIEKMHFYIHEQTPSILTDNYCSLYIQSTNDLFYIKQMSLRSIIQFNLKNLSLPVKISSQAQNKAIFKHLCDGYFSF